MFNKPKDFQLLVDAFKSLPAVGTKNAHKYAYYLLKQDEKYITDFVNRIRNAKANLTYCKYCHNLTNQEVCNICVDESRDKHLFIVEDIFDLEHIEDLRLYNGYYHVLHGELNFKKNISNKDIYINDIIDHIKAFDIREVTIATSFSIEGEMTCEYIKNQLQSLNDLKVYRIGFGLSNNSSINYSDEQTLKFALMNKRKVL